MTRYEPDKQSAKLKDRRRLVLLGFALLSCLVVVSFLPRYIAPPVVMSTSEAAEPAEPVREPVDFLMTDFSHGWLAYKDSVLTTEDGGVHWNESGSATIPQTQRSSAAGPPEWMLGTLPNPETIIVQSKEIKVKKAQFLTQHIGWALAANKGRAVPLWITTDGGNTWSQPSPETAQGVEAERDRLQNMVKEAAYYTQSESARKAIQGEWTLFPESAAPGDVVLVRYHSNGTVWWQGKTYVMQPFGSGYFTYLPIPMGTKPGTYQIGNRTLTIQNKKFDTQYLQVTKQMESMRQDTKRIQEDQKQIDKARSESQPEFLFTAPFVQPVDGILTTPFGYTRYVNGKLDSSHMAVDLAAKQGTPVMATNDGVVALAENFYLTGNSIYIDHGMHLFSQYAHMSELRVQAGDVVKQGDVIGLVGSTGFSTGPHLHFTFWAHNVPANPNLFFGTTPFGWLQPSP